MTKPKKKIDLQQAHVEAFSLRPNMPQISMFKISDITAGKNPRKKFDKEKLTDLAESIKKHGVLSPILLEVDDSGYKLIAGERRWRASKLAGLKEVPGILKTDVNSAEIALIENIQREDLTPIEEAAGYQNLMSINNYSLRALSEVVGKSKSSIGEVVSILKLPEQILLEHENYPHITKSHLILLAGEKNTKKQIELWTAMKQGRLNVRDTKAKAKGKKTSSELSPAERSIQSVDKAITRLEKVDVIQCNGYCTVKGCPEKNQCIN